MNAQELIVDKSVQMNTIEVEKLLENPNRLCLAFQVAAYAQGWSEEEINWVLEEATSENSDHVFATLEAYIEPM